jgi:hypothetical protein
VTAISDVTLTRNRVPVLLLIGAVAAACGARPSSAPQASDPSAAVADFLAAVRANDLAAMGQHWGTGERGPAARWLNAETLHQRLFVMQSMLAHERYEILADNAPVSADGDRVLRVRLWRKGCEPVVPFTVVRYREGWLVEAVGIEAAGNPARTCG